MGVRNLFLPGCLLLAGCALSGPVPVTPGTNAVVEATSAVSNALSQSNHVTMESVNGKPVGMTESTLELPPGQYAIDAECTAYDDAGDVFSGKGTIDAPLQAGHRYVFTTEDPTKRSLGESFWVLTHSGPFKKPSQLEGFLMSLSDDCAPFLYDATSDRNPYPEQVTLVPPTLDKGWKSIADDRHAGHWLVDEIPMDESVTDSKTVMETEYWSKLMYPKSADALFKERMQAIKKTCPDVQLTVSTETDDTVDYDLEITGCASTSVKSELGHYLSGQYGVHRAAVLSRETLTEPDKAAWAQSLKNVSLTIL